MNHVLRFRHLLPSLILALVLALPTFAEDATSTAPVPKVRTQPSTFAGTPLERLAPLVGTWEIEGQWADGNSIWSRNEFSVGLGGKFLFARTWTKNEAGEVYERYQTHFGYDQANDQIKSWGFTYDGSVSEVDHYEVEVKDGKPHLTSYWGAETEQIKQTIILDSDSAYRWLVWFRNSDTAEWQQMMDGTWKRVD